MHDNFIDLGSGAVGGNTVTGIKTRDAFEVYSHDNLFAGSPTQTCNAIDSDTTYGHIIHDNFFETNTVDILLGANATVCHDYNNESVSAGITAAPQAVLRTDNNAPGSNLTDTPVLIANLPTGWPRGVRSFVSNGSAAAVFGGAMGVAGAAPLPVCYTGAAWVYG